MNVQKEARKDAREFARAAMYYGEGAGTRRKLIAATVDSKALRNPEYGRAFRQELDRQDLAEHAAKARKERARRDNAEKVSKNVKGLATGNYQSVSTSIVVTAALAYLAHQSGLDKKAYDKAKEIYNRYKFRREAKREVNKIININHNN